MTQKPFAIYRLPFADECVMVVQASGAIDTIGCISELEGKHGFVMIPFGADGGRSPVLIRPDEVRTMSVEDVEALRQSACDGAEIPDEISENLPESTCATEGYSNAFAAFHASLASGRFDKLVLSRCVDVPYGGCVFGAFVRACKAYPRMMVYVCNVPGYGLWMGCTPEILLSGKKSHYRTVALAGTVPVKNSDGRMEVGDWTEKNRREQQIVSDYVRGVISSFASVVEEEGPYTARAGQLLHLKTHFHFSPSEGARISDMIEKLHPTPAVCGMPKDEAREFISANEGYDREYYSGVVGMLDPSGKTDLYVNLRCAKIFKDEDGACVARLYAGGGILASSDIASEWRETEEKLKTVGAVLYPEQ